MAKCWLWKKEKERSRKQTWFLLFFSFFSFIFSFSIMGIQYEQQFFLCTREVWVQYRNINIKQTDYKRGRGEGSILLFDFLLCRFHRMVFSLLGQDRSKSTVLSLYRREALFNRWWWLRGRPTPWWPGLPVRSIESLLFLGCEGRRAFCLFSV